MRYRNKHAIVTGGLGFIGSNLSLRLIEEGARVTVIDSAIPGCGGNRFNLQPAGGRINVLVRDIVQAEELPSVEGGRFRRTLGRARLSHVLS